MNFPQPKIVREAPASVDFKPVWNRLFCPLLSLEEREIQFLIIHKKLPVSDRLFQIGMKNDPYCLYCPGAVIGDIEHFFSSCVRTQLAWNRLKTKLLQLCSGCLLTSNAELLSFFLPVGSREPEFVWLIGKFSFYAWTTVFIKDSDVKIDKFIGFLKFKFKNEKLKALIGGLGQFLLP